MKKIYSLALLISIANASSPITSVEIKTSLGKAILNQQKIQSNQNILFNQIHQLKQEVKELQKIKKLYESQTKNTLDVSAIKHATIRTYFANVRSKPSINSAVIKKYSMCQTVDIEECTLSNNGENWCKISNNGGYIKNYLLSFSSTIMSTNNLETNHKLQITGISLDGEYACLLNGKSIPTYNLK